MTDEQKNNLIQELSDKIDNLLKNIRNERDLMRVARIASCMSTNLHNSVFSEIASIPEWEMYCIRLEGYQTDKKLEENFRDFLSVDSIDISFFDDFNTIISFQSFPDAIEYIMRHVTHVPHKNLRGIFYWQWYIAEGWKYAGFRYN